LDTKRRDRSSNSAFSRGREIEGVSKGNQRRRGLFLGRGEREKICAYAALWSESEEMSGQEKQEKRTFQVRVPATPENGKKYVIYLR